MENLKVKKQSNLITQDELIYVARDEMNEVGKFIYTIWNSLYCINDSINTLLGKSHTDSQMLAVSETTLLKNGWRVKILIFRTYLFITSSFECVDW